MVTTLLLAFAHVRQEPASCCDPMAGLAADPAFVAMHEPPLPLKFAPAAGKSVRFATADGSTAGGFYVPPKTPRSPGIVMVHEWWGLNDYIRREAERQLTQSALDGGILKAAAANARTTLTSLLQGLGFEAVSFR